MWPTVLRKIRGDILDRKARTLLVSASIFVGVMGLIALFSTRAIINQRLTEDVQPSRLSMIDVLVRVDSSNPENARYLETLNGRNDSGQAVPALAAIEVVEGQAFYPIRFQKPGAADFEEGELRSFSSPLEAVQIEPPRLYAGAWPQPGRGELMVEKRFADLFGFQIGDAIVLRGAGGQNLTRTISGLVVHPYIFKGLSNENPGPEIGIYAQFADAQQILGFAGYNRFVARYPTFNQALLHYPGFQQAIRNLTPYVPIFPTYEDPADNIQVQDATIFNNIFTSLGLITMIVSGFLVINVINTIIAEQRRQIGALKAIGASTGETFLIYCGIALVYGFLGTILAILPGVLVGNLMARYLADTLDILLEGFHVAPSAIALGMVMGLTVPVLAALVPVFNGVRVRIVDAMLDLGISSQYGQGLAAAILGRLPLPISIRQALTNVYQKRWRLALTGTTLTLTIATFMATVAVTISLNNELHRLFDRIHYEFDIHPNEAQDPAHMDSLLTSVPGIAASYPASLYWIDVQGDYQNFYTRNSLLQVYGVSPEAPILEWRWREGRGWADDPNREGVVISTAVARQLQLATGDSFHFRVGGQMVTREIIGIEENVFDAAYLKWDDLAQLAGSISGVPRPNQYTVLATLPEVGQSAFLVGVDETMLRVMLDLPSSSPGVIISGRLAESAGLEVGELLTVNAAGHRGERRIDAILPNETLAATARELNPDLRTVPDNVILFGFNDLLTLTQLSLEGDPIPNAYYIVMEDHEASPADVDRAIERVETALLAAGISARSINRVAAEEMLQRVVLSNTSMVGVATLLIALVGAIGLLTTLSIAVLERQKEIGVMRSIGAGSSTVAFQFLTEGLLVGLIAWLFAIPLSYLLAEQLYAAFQLKYVPFTFPLQSLWIGLGSILLIVTLASIGPSMNAARKTVSEILRYQ